MVGVTVGLREQLFRKVVEGTPVGDLTGDASGLWRLSLFEKSSRSGFQGANSTGPAK